MRLFGLLLLFCSLLAVSGCVVVQNPKSLDTVNQITHKQNNADLGPISEFHGPLAQARRSQSDDEAAPDGKAVTDNVLVTGRSLSGYWMVEGPSSIDYHFGILSGLEITYDLTPRPRNICIIHDNQGQLDAICAAGTAETAQGARKGTDFKLVWTDTGGSLIFTGSQLDANVIDGALSGGVLGLGLTGGVPAKLFRLDAFTAPKTHDLSPLMAQVITDVHASHP